MKNILAAGPSSQGHEPQKSLLQGLLVFYIFKKSGKNKFTDLAVSQLQGSTIAITSAHKQEVGNKLLYC